MHSLTELYRIGTGPSASHTMGPRNAAEIFKEKYPNAAMFKIVLYGSLAATGKGHLTNIAITEALKPKKSLIVWKPEIELPTHPNAMIFEALDSSNNIIGNWTVYSIGGGALKDESDVKLADVYKNNSMDEILNWSQSTGKPIWQYVIQSEGEVILAYLTEVWNAMKAAIERGINTTGVLPGSLKLARKASSYYQKAGLSNQRIMAIGHLTAYALAVSEENAAGGIVVTAPTCGSSGVVPAILKHIQEMNGCPDSDILSALATAGLIGNLVKHNASISGAEVGCQGEVGTACAMAAAAAAQLLGGTPRQIEYAAEIGIEHHLGLTCDPVSGLVQIPCIERNAFAAVRAFDCAVFALLSDGSHRISFDDVVKTMKETGIDMQSKYRETSAGGLAKHFHSE